MLDEWRGPFEDPTHSLSRIVGALGAYGMTGLASNWARYGDLPWQYLVMTLVAVVLVLGKPDRGAQRRSFGLPRR